MHPVLFSQNLYITIKNSLLVYSRGPVNFASLAPAPLAFVLWKVGSPGVGKRRGGASEKEKEWWSGSISSGDPELLQYRSLLLQSSASLRIARSPAHLCCVDIFSSASGHVWGELWFWLWWFTRWRTLYEYMNE